MSQSLSRYKYGVLAVAAVVAYGASYLVGEEGDEGIVAKLAADNSGQVAEATPTASEAPRTRVRTTPRSEEIVPDDFYDDPEVYRDVEGSDPTPEGLTEEYNREGPVQHTARVPNSSEQAAGLAARSGGDTVPSDGQNGRFQ